MTDLALLVFRTLLVAIFPISGYYKIIGWPHIVGIIQKSGLPYADYLGMAAAAAEIVLPLFVVFGVATRWAALGLLVYTVMATYIGHPIWNVPPERFFGELMNFMRNVSICGGLLALTALGPGRLALQPSRDYA